MFTQNNKSRINVKQGLTTLGDDDREDIKENCQKDNDLVLSLSRQTPQSSKITL